MDHKLSRRNLDAALPWIGFGIFFCGLALFTALWSWSTEAVLSFCFGIIGLVIILFWLVNVPAAAKVYLLSTWPRRLSTLFSFVIFSFLIVWTVRKMVSYHYNMLNRESEIGTEHEALQQSDQSLRNLRELTAEQERRNREEWHPPNPGAAQNSFVDFLSRHSWNEQPTVVIAYNGTVDSQLTALNLLSMFRGAGWEAHIAGWDVPSVEAIPHGLSIKTGGIPSDNVSEIAASLAQALGSKTAIIKQSPLAMEVLNRHNQQITVNLLVMLGTRVN
jgi:hypothetical protein